jgi:hypothetical protein
MMPLQMVWQTTTTVGCSINVGCTMLDAANAPFTAVYAYCFFNPRGPLAEDSVTVANLKANVLGPAAGVISSLPVRNPSVPQAGGR